MRLRVPPSSGAATPNRLWVNKLRDRETNMHHLLRCVVPEYKTPTNFPRCALRVRMAPDILLERFRLSRWSKRDLSLF